MDSLVHYNVHFLQLPDIPVLREPISAMEFLDFFRYSLIPKIGLELQLGYI